MQQIIFLSHFDALIEKEKPTVVWLGIGSKTSQHFVNLFCVASAYNNLGNPVQLRIDKGSAMVYDEKTKKEIWDAAKETLTAMEEKLIAGGIEVRDGMFDIDGKGISATIKV